MGSIAMTKNNIFSVFTLGPWNDRQGDHSRTHHCESIIAEKMDKPNFQNKGWVHGRPI